MHFITSNYNNISTNSYWSKLKNKAKIDEDFNNFFLSLNNKALLDSYDAFHIKLYLNDYNLKENIQKLRLLKKKNI